MLPLSLLKTAQNHPMLVELKNRETYNVNLCYICGSTIKYLCIPNEIIDMVQEEAAKGCSQGGPLQQKQQKGRGMGGAGPGVFGCQGRGGIPGTGRGQTEKKPGQQAGKQ
ncbi:U6 snRNA-associated Sm LSm4 [Sigmodon hispidus]